MNIKPSLEQVNKWDIASIAYADETTDQYPCWEDARNMGFAELAAQWGAEQAQQTADPLGFQIRRAIAAEDELRATKQTLEHAYAALQKVADAQAAIKEPELPEAVAWQGRWLDQSDDAEGWSEWRAIDTIDLPRWQKRVANKPGCYEIRALYTATQMHDHYQAGVRAGAARSQDARRYQWLREQQWQDNKLGVVLRPKDNTVLGCFIPSKERLDEVIDRHMSGKNDAMQKGQK